MCLATTSKDNVQWCQVQHEHKAELTQIQAEMGIVIEQLPKGALTKNMDKAIVRELREFVSDRRDQLLAAAA